MLVYNRVIRLSATILTDNLEFKGKALGIPPLREKIDSLTGSLTEQEIVSIAEKLYEDYKQIYENDKEKWKQIKYNQVGKRNTIRGCRVGLRSFINKYKEE